MSNHRSPEGVAPDDVRCEALVKGHPGYHWQWVQHDHRCPKRANQMRADVAVCHIHARSKTMEKWNGTL